MVRSEARRAESGDPRVLPRRAPDGGGRAAGAGDAGPSPALKLYLSKHLDVPWDRVHEEAEAGDRLPVGAVARLLRVSDPDPEMLRYLTEPEICSATQSRCSNVSPSKGRRRVRPQRTRPPRRTRSRHGRQTRVALIDPSVTRRRRPRTDGRHIALGFLAQSTPSIMPWRPRRQRPWSTDARHVAPDGLHEPRERLGTV